MAMSFLRLYSWLALAFSTFALGITGLTTWIAFSLASVPAENARLHLSPLHAFVLSNFRFVSLAALIYCATAVIASAGLMKRRLWALWTWIVLLSLSFLWSLGVAVFEFTHFAFTRSSDTASELPFTAELGPLASIPIGLVMAAILALLIRKLIWERRGLAVHS